MANHINRQRSYTSVLCEFQHLQMQIQSIYHGKTIHEQHTEIYDLRYCAVALLKALTTSTTLLKCTKIIQIELLSHLRTNAVTGLGNEVDYIHIDVVE